MTEARHRSKTKLLDAALTVVRTKGYSATRVEDICAAAGVTKGSFFHHFDSKDELALAAAEHWRDSANALFAAATYHKLADPLDQLLAYLDLRKAMLTGEMAEWTCFAGTVVQEIYATNPALNGACARSIAEHAAALARIIDAAMRRYGAPPGCTAEGLGLHMQAVIQGAFILAKAEGQACVAAESIDHLRRYLELLFRPPGQKPAAKRHARQARGTAP
jgi:TetR/AcrR family transcriptional repressor of nem operon